MSFVKELNTKLYLKKDKLKSLKMPKTMKIKNYGSLSPYKNRKN